MKSCSSWRAAGLAAIALVGLGQVALASPTVFVDPTIGISFQEAQENAFLAATGSLSVVHFDEFTAPYLFNGDEYLSEGITFSQPYGNTMYVGIGAGAVPRSAPYVLGPSGGHTEGDGYVAAELVTPQAALGFWLIDNDINPNGMETADFYNAADELIVSIPLPALGTPAENSDTNFFLGVISPDNLIASVIVRDSADEGGVGSDETIGLDDVYFGVPEPATLSLLLIGLVALRRRSA